MIHDWHWLMIAGFALLAALQQFFVYRIGRNSRKREELFQIITENAADMIALVDVKGRRLYNSPAYKRILGYSAAELGETSAFEQIHPDDRFKVLAAAHEARETGIGKKMEYRIRHKNGGWRVFESSASTIRDAQGDVVKMVIVNRDITERKRAEEKLEHNAFHDALTGLPNRRLFLDRLEHLFLRSQRNPEIRYAVLFAEVEGFGAGREGAEGGAGDQALSEIARRMQSSLRGSDAVAPGAEKLPAPDDVLCRYGGCGFAVVLDEVAHPGDAMRVARRMQAAVAEPLLAEGAEIKSSLSVGIALNVVADPVTDTVTDTVTHSGADAATRAVTPRRPEEILEEAQAAMHRARALGPSRIEVFDEATHARALGRLSLEDELRAALDRREFRVFYHPMVELRTRRIMAFEALLRWQHPRQGLISPYAFLEAAEDTGLLVHIGRWLMVEACHELRAWREKSAAAAALKITVNLSARQLHSGQLCRDLALALGEGAIEASRLELEIGEGTAAEARLGDPLSAQLRHLGVGVIVGEVGSGQLSLASLRQFPVTALKIGRPLVGAMLADRGSADLVDVIVALAHKMNLTAIAEGIESTRQLERLRELGCDWGQGFLFSHPVDAQAAEKLLREAASHAGAAAVPAASGR